MAGLAWFVQVVHYPLFAGVGAQGFADYEREHQRRTGFVVVPAMLCEAACAGLLLLLAPRDPWVLAGAGLLAAIWISTFAVQVPLHVVRTTVLAPDVLGEPEPQELAQREGLECCLGIERGELFAGTSERQLRVAPERRDDRAAAEPATYDPGLAAPGPDTQVQIVPVADVAVPRFGPERTHLRIGQRHLPLPGYPSGYPDLRTAPDVGEPWRTTTYRKIRDLKRKRLA